MSVHEKIKQIRHTKGLTQEEVAAKLQMSNNGYGDIERGETDIKLSRLQQLADLFEVTLSDIIGLSDKAILNLVTCEKNKFHQTVNSSLHKEDQLKSELEKQLLINEMKDKELAMQQRENENLREIIVLLKEKQGTK